MSRTMRADSSRSSETLETARRVTPASSGSRPAARSASRTPSYPSGEVTTSNEPSSLAATSSAPASIAASIRASSSTPAG